MGPYSLPGGDLTRMNGRVFVNNACMGLYAKIVQSDIYRDAKLKTAADMLPICWIPRRRVRLALYRARRPGMPHRPPAAVVRGSSDISWA